MKVELPFGIIYETQNHVAELEMSDGTIRFAVQMEDGTYWGQRWIEQSRHIPCWKNRKIAEVRLASINAGLPPVEEDLGVLEKFE